MGRNGHKDSEREGGESAEGRKIEEVRIKLPPTLLPLFSQIRGIHQWTSGSLHLERTLSNNRAAGIMWGR